MNTADRIDAESQKDPDRLEREIDQQREDIGDIVDALENKLSPGQMFDRLVHFGKGNGREFAQNLGNTVKAHPVPTLLTSVGLLWLYAARNDTRPAYRGQSIYRGTADSEGGLKARAHEVGEQISDKWDQARSGMEGVSDRMHDAGSRVGESLHGAGQTVREQGERAREGFNHMLNDNPLALGAIGIAVGALMGAVLPRTEQEDRMMGGTRDHLADKARQTAHSAADEARDTLREATDGSSSGSMGEGGSRFH